MKTTLVTTCWNERDNVVQWLQDLFAQTCPPDEVIIIDNYSSDGTYEELGRHSEAIRVVQMRCTVAQGRNEAIRLASNNLIVSTDMGTRLHCCWFENIVAPFSDPQVQVVAGNYEYVYPVHNAISRAERFYKNNGCAKLGPQFLPSSRNIAFLKSVWEEIGGYQEGLKNATDDTIFAYEIHSRSYKMALAADSVVYWNRHSEIEGYLKEISRYAFGNGEARLRTIILTDSVRSRMYPLSSIGYAAYSMLRSAKAVVRAIVRNDYSMIFYIPLFVFLTSLEYAKWYQKGYLSDNENLDSIRERVKALGLS